MSNLYPAARRATLTGLATRLSLGLLLLFCLGARAAEPALRVLDIAEHAHDGGAALAIVLSSPLSPKEDHGRWISLTRDDGKPVDGAWVLADNQRTLNFPNIEPQTSYKVTINPGLKAANGNELAEAQSKEIKTRNIAPSISFVGKGSLLPAKLDRGLPVASVNVEEVDIDFHRVNGDKLEELFQLASDDGLREFWNLSRLKELATPVYSGRFALNPPPNKRRESRIPLDPIEALRPPGVYVAVMRAANRYDTDLTDAIHFTITDIALHARFYGDRLDVNLRSIADGGALDKVQLRLLDKSGRQLGEASSTPDGLATFTGLESDRGKNARYITAQLGDYFTLLDIQRPALDLSDFNVGQRPFRPTELFLYGPRDLYRPGEELVVSGLLRDQDGRSTHAPALKARFRKPDGALAREFTWQPQEGGYYETRYRLPAGAQTGKWRLQVDLPGGKVVDQVIRVEEFLPERMKLELQPGGKVPLFAPGQELLAPVRGEYLYGAPAAGNALETQVAVRHFREPLPQWKGFQFGNLKEQDLLQEFALDEVRLDAEGKVELKVPSRWQQARSPLDIQLTCSLFESGGRPVTRGASHLVWPADQALVGIKADFGAKNPEENREAGFEVILAKADGSLAAGRKLRAQLITEDRQYFWEWSSGQGWHYEFSETEYAVEGAELTSADKPVRFKLPLKYGHYRLEVTDVETGLLSSLRFHAGRDWYYWWQRAQVDREQAARPDLVSLSLDKPVYQPGGTAVLTIVPPADGDAIVLMETDRPLWSKRLKVAKAGTKLELPIDPKLDRHDIYVSAVVFQPAGAGGNATPTRAFGLTPLRLDRKDRRLDISVEAPEKTRPNQQVSVKVRLTGSKANASTRVTLAAVDVGVLGITRFATPDPLEGFFGQRRYGIEVRDLYDRIISPGQGALARLRFGGGEEAEADKLHGEPPKSDVAILSLFSGPVQFNPEGMVSIPLQLPDFNGRVRLMALAYDEDHYGHAEREMTVAAAMVSQLSLPRFLAPGDSARLALDLHNLSGQSQDYRAILSADGPVEILREPYVSELPDGDKKTLYFDAQGKGMSGQSRVRLVVEGLREQDGQPVGLQRQWHLGVRPAWPATSRRENRVLQPGERYQPGPGLTEGLLPETTRLRLTVAASPILDLHEQLEHLLTYPYGCLEQTASSTYPLVLADPAALAALKLESPFNEAERREQIRKGLERLYAMQKQSGGFGLWTGDDAEAHWLTAYVGDLLLDAREAGVEVAPERLERTLNQLGQYLRRNGLLTEQRYSSDPKHYAFAVKSYAGYVLARARQAPLGSLRSLYDQSAGDSQGGLPLIHLGLALHLMGDPPRGLAAIERGLALGRKENGYYGDYGSPLRDTARALYLLLSHDVAKDKAAPLVFTLADQLRARRYLSTQERNALFLAGLALTRQSQAPWQASLQLGAQQERIDGQGGWSRLISGQELTAGLQLTSDAQQPLYVSIQARGYGAQSPAPSGDNLTVARAYYDREGKHLEPKEVAEGDILLARLDVSSKERRPDLLLVDALPAGFELENPNLPDSVRLDDLRIDDKTVAEWNQAAGVQHQEFRDDRYLAALDLEAGASAHLFYVVRAVTPGRYKMPPPLLEDMYAPEQFAVGAVPVAEVQVAPRAH